jgi:putative transposase
MLKAYKYRLYPAKRQVSLLEQHFGAVRLVYNLGLEVKSIFYKMTGRNLSRFDLQKQLVDLKSEFEWLKQVNSQSLQVAILNLDNAFNNFFKHRGRYPKFKSKRNKKSFSCPNPKRYRIDFAESVLYIPKFMAGIPIVIHRKFNGEVRAITISRTSTGKYFASILVDNKKELPEKQIPNRDRAIGVDVGLNSFVTVGNFDLSESFKVENPKYLVHNEILLARRQKQLSRKVRGGHNRDKARLRVARLCEKISNQRKDFANKISYRLVNDSQVNAICIEDLNVRGMMKNHRLAKAIGDVAWGELFRQLKYKSDWAGKNILEAGRFSSTSRDCHKCGYKNNSLTLSDRVWDCPDCGAHHDRDENAVPNIITSAFLKYNKNRDGLPESTPAESLPLSCAYSKGKARTMNQEKFRKEARGCIHERSQNNLTKPI